MIEMEDGWFALWMEYTRSNSSTASLTVCLGTASHTTDRPSATWLGTETLHLWGGQGANTNFITSPVLGDSPASRAADTPSLLVSAWDWEQDGPNFLTVTARSARGSGTQVLLQLDDGSESNRYRLVRNGSNEIHLIVTVGGVEQCDLNLGIVANDTAFKVAVRLAQNDIAVSLNGGTVVADASGSLPQSRSCGSATVSLVSSGPLR